MATKNANIGLTLNYKWSNGEIHRGVCLTVGPKWVSFKNEKSGKTDWVVPTNVTFPEGIKVEIAAPAVEEKKNKKVA